MTDTPVQSLDLRRQITRPAGNVTKPVKHRAEHRRFDRNMLLLILMMLVAFVAVVMTDLPEFVLAFDMVVRRTHECPELLGSAPRDPLAQPEQQSEAACWSWPGSTPEH